MAGTILHIVFGDAGAEALRPVLLQLGRGESIAVCRDHLELGPIAPADSARRAAWIAQELGIVGWVGLLFDIEVFWATVLGNWGRRVLWLTRRVAAEYAGFLECLRRLGDMPCEIIDLTDAVVMHRWPDGKRDKRPALCLALLDEDDIIDNQVLSWVAPLTSEQRNRYCDAWQKLRVENAPLRVVTPELALCSAPLTHFDAMLLSFVVTSWRKSAYVIGHMLATEMAIDLFNAGDFFFASRLAALAAAGVIEAKGNVARIRFSEVRLPPRG